MQSAIGFTVNDRTKAALRDWEQSQGPLSGRAISEQRAYTDKRRTM